MVKKWQSSILLEKIYWGVANRGKPILGVFFAHMSASGHQNGLKLQILNRGPPGGVLDPDFLWQNRPYPEIPLEFFDFADPDFSSSSSRQVFLFSTESLI